MSANHSQSHTCSHRLGTPHCVSVKGADRHAHQACSPGRPFNTSGRLQGPMHVRDRATALMCTPCMQDRSRGLVSRDHARWPGVWQSCGLHACARGWPAVRAWQCSLACASPHPCHQEARMLCISGGNHITCCTETAQYSYPGLGQYPRLQGITGSCDLPDSVTLAASRDYREACSGPVPDRYVCWVPDSHMSSLSHNSKATLAGTAQHAMVSFCAMQALMLTGQCVVQVLQGAVDIDG